MIAADEGVDTATALDRKINLDMNRDLKMNTGPDYVHTLMCEVVPTMCQMYLRYTPRKIKGLETMCVTAALK